MTDPNLTLITLEKQPDGNWIGRAVKFGKEIEVREVGPETCLQAILVHNGEERTN